MYEEEKHFETVAPRILSEPFTSEAFNGAFLRVYPDCSPHNLEISNLQKGLILVRGGRELVEEGAGFGVPVVKYSDKTFFSSTAELLVREDGHRRTILKSFVMDAVSRKKMGRGALLNDSIYRPLQRAFSLGYLSLRPLRPVFDKVMELRCAAGVRTQFVKERPRGRINVAYNCIPGSIRVEVDLRGLDRNGCEEFVMLNEQGAMSFRKYSDSSGLELSDRRIGAWDRIDASEASLSDLGGTVSFSLSRAPCATYYRGWERIEGRLSWAGINYSLRRIPSAFGYTIRLGGSGLRGDSA